MVIAVLMAACGSSNDEGEATTTTESTSTETTTLMESTTSQAPDGDVVLRIAGDGYAHTAAAVEAFEASHPGITVEYAEGNLNFEEGVPQALLQSGQGPDILILNAGPGRAGELAKAGLTADLSELYDDLDLASVYPETLMNQLEAQYGGQISEMVEVYSAFQIYYNKALFDDAGLDEPESWEALVEACQSLADSGVEPMTLGTRSGFAAGWLGGVLLASSVSIDEMTEIIYEEASFEQPDVIRGFEMLEELVTGPCIDGPTAAAIDYNQSFASFYNNQAAMVAGNEFVLIGAVDSDVDISQFGSFAIPPRDGGGDVVYSGGMGKSWVLNAESTEREAALAWLAWVTTDEYLNIVVDAGSYIPAARLPDGAELAPSLARTGEILANEELGYNPSNYFSGAGTQAWYEALQSLVIGEITPAEAAAAVQQALESN